MSRKIDAATRMIGLLGHPVGHSLSSLFMNHAIMKLGVNARYLTFDVTPEDLGVAVEGVRALGFLGTNVTIPHKTAVIAHLNRIEEDARRIGAVNCIYRDEDLLIGTNTDHSGFINPLKKRGISFGRQDALLLGCGGAARAVVYTLLNEGVGNIHIVNRTREKAAALTEWCRGQFPESSCSYVGESGRLSQAIVDGCRLIVNTTPVGMLPNTGVCPLPDSIEIGEGQVVYDLIYNPVETKLLARARRSGAVAINGLEMLIFQGVFSLFRWFPGRREEILSLESTLLELTKRSLES